VIERCSCNALFVTLSHRRLQQWRQEHRHELPEDAEQSAVVESASSHERAWPIGFTAESP